MKHEQVSERGVTVRVEGGGGTVKGPFPTRR